MAISNIIAQGIGFSPGSTKFIPTLGFSIGAALTIPTIKQPTYAVVLSSKARTEATVLSSKSKTQVTVET